MSTRVQKGGPTFRPVAKVKARSRPPTATPAPASQEPQTESISTSLPPSSSEVTLVGSMSISSTLSESISHDKTPASTFQITTIQPSRQGPPSISSSSRNVIRPPSQRPPNPPPSTPTQNGLTWDANSTSQASSSTAVNVTQSSSYISDIGNITSSSTARPDDSQMAAQKTTSASLPASPTPTPDQNSAAESSKTVRTRKVPESVSEAPKLRRKRKAAADKPVSDSEGAESPKKRSRRRASTESGQTGRESAIRIEPNADPGEELDPTMVTMASLCSDTGQGRVSSRVEMIQSNHASWKTQNKEKRARMRLRMELKKVGRDLDAEEAGETQEGSSVSAAGPSMSTAAASSVSDTGGNSASTVVDDESGQGFDYSQNIETSRFNVRVRLGQNGETIVDEESLFVDREEGDETANYTHVVESDHSKFTNSMTYQKRLRGQRWSTDETELFYHALAQFGENYEMISMMLPGRDRKACKNKFKAEDKRNPERINAYLRNQIPVDVEALGQRTGKDFSGPTPEINIPTPPPAVKPSLTPVPSSEARSTDTPGPSSASGPARKRSRSRTGVPEDGVTILGGIDDYDAGE